MRGRRSHRPNRNRTTKYPGALSELILLARSFALRPQLAGRSYRNRPRGGATVAVQLKPAAARRTISIESLSSAHDFITPSERWGLMRQLQRTRVRELG